MTKSPASDQMTLFESKVDPPSPLEHQSINEASEPSSTALVERSARKVLRKERKTSSLVPPGDMRLTVNIRQDIHLKLKIAAAQKRTTVGDLIETLAEKYLK